MSAYPGSTFPLDCKTGFGGKGSYGVYKSCETQDHAHANHVDWDPSIVTCGSGPERPYVSGCDKPVEYKPKSACSIEGFDGGDSCKPKFFADEQCGAYPPSHCGSTKCGVPDAENPGCKKPVWFADETCRLPYENCGSAPCNKKLKSVPTTNEGDIEGNDDMEGFDGAMTSSCGALKPVTLGDVSDCDAKLEVVHENSCYETKCDSTYSQPYFAAPGCGKPWSNCAKKEPLVQRMEDRARTVNPLREMKSVFGRHTFIANVVIALLVAALAYKLLTRK